MDRLGTTHTTSGTRDPGTAMVAPVVVPVILRRHRTTPGTCMLIGTDGPCTTPPVQHLLILGPRTVLSTLYACEIHAAAVTRVIHEGMRDAHPYSTACTHQHARWVFAGVRRPVGFCVTPVPDDPSGLTDG